MSNLASIFGGRSVTTVRGPSRDRRLPGKKRIRARREQARLSREPIQKSTPPLMPEPTPLPIYSEAELEAMTMKDLTIVAKDFGLRGFSRLKKDTLPYFIFQSSVNQRIVE